jgi:hypothetical protein
VSRPSHARQHLERPAQLLRGFGREGQVGGADDGLEEGCRRGDWQGG